MTIKPLDSFNTMTLYTKTDTIFSGAAAATLTGYSQPPTGGCFLRVEIDAGTTGSGTITINGTETLSFASDDWQISSTKYTTITSITTSGLADEVSKPNIKIEAVDMAGNPINWSTTATYPCQFVLIKPSRYARAMLSAQGLKAPSFYRVRVAYEVEIVLGQEFTIDGQLQTYIIWEEPIRHFQLGTDLIEYIEFIATIKK